MVMGLLITADQANAQEKSEWAGMDKSPLQFSYYPSDAAWRNYLEGDKRTMSPKIKVMYSAPMKNDRVIFGTLLPFGTEWRMGANEATEITFYEAVEINGTVIPRGSYTLFATPSKDKWNVTVSSERFISGTNGRDKSKDIVSISVPTSKTSKVREQMAFGFREIDANTVHMLVEWDDTKVAIPIGFNVPSFPGVDVSPADLVQFPNSSKYMNRLKPEEKEGKGPLARITYSRPQKKGRTIFGDLLKYGEPWRLGANESTELTLFKEAMIGGKTVKAGIYNMYAIVNEKDWTIILNTDRPAWGVANRDESKDVAQFKVNVTSDKEMLEAMTMRFKEKDTKNADLLIGWDTTRVSIPFSFK